MNVGISGEHGEMGAANPGNKSFPVFGTRFEGTSTCSSIRGHSSKALMAGIDVWIEPSDGDRSGCSQGSVGFTAF